MSLGASTLIYDMYDPIRGTFWYRGIIIPKCPRVLTLESLFRSLKCRPEIRIGFVSGSGILYATPPKANISSFADVLSTSS